MKRLTIIFGLLVSHSIFGCDKLNLQMPGNMDELVSLVPGKVVKKILQKEHGEDKEYFFIRENQEELQVFGMTEAQVLEEVGERHGRSCLDKTHQQGDLVNRWCHAAVVKILDHTIREELELNPAVSALLAATIFLPKEYLIDKHPSSHDLVVTEFPAHTDRKKERDLKITVFADGVFFLNYQGKF